MNLIGADVREGLLLLVIGLAVVQVKPIGSHQPAAVHLNQSKWNKTFNKAKLGYTLRSQGTKCWLAKAPNDASKRANSALGADSQISSE